MAPKSPLRKPLAESGIAAVAVAVLLLWSLVLGFWAIWTPFWRVAYYMVTAIAILGLPTESFTFSDRATLFAALYYLLEAFVSLAAAWLLAGWAYGAGPLRALRESADSIKRRINV